MNLLLKQVLFRLPKNLPSNFSSLTSDYRLLVDQWCGLVFDNSEPHNHHATRNQAQSRISQSTSFLSLILSVLPNKIFEENLDCWGIADTRWQEWLESLWACDGDALCLLACPAALVEKLPLSWAPVNALTSSHDAHVHLSALPPNALLWGAIMALGITGESGSGSLHSAFASSSSMKEEARLARVILCTLRALSKIDDTKLPTGIFNIYANARNSIGTNTSNVEIALKFEIAFPDLGADIFNEALICSDCFNVATSMAMLQEERRIIAQTLKRCRRGRSEWNWLLDLLVLYWQCKGEWLLSIQGEKSNSSLFSFRSQAARVASFVPKPVDEVNLGFRRRFDDLVTSGFQAHLKARKTPVRLDLRIALAGMSELRASSSWLDAGLEGADTKFFIGLKRRDDFKGRGDTEFDEALSEEKIDNYFQNLAMFENIKTRVCGIDVFGFEATTCWSDYLPLMRHAAEHVKRLTGSCIVTFHCGEDTVCSLKGILDMWRNVNELRDIGDCRISHALALLNPHEYPTDTPINYRLWGDMSLAANRLLRYARSNDSLKHKALELEKLWSAVESIATGGQDGMTVPKIGIDMAEVFERFRDAIAEDLIAQKVILEVCPTSNWRIGHVNSPLSHPIRYWRDKGGQWLIGTDDPCFIPCSVESELANVTFSLR